MNLVDCKTALKILKSGLPIIFPTDTLPAIGCLPKFSNTIYKFKKRDRDKPLILMGSEQKQLIDYVHESAKEDYENIASKYWPGALTMVLPASKKTDYNPHKQWSYSWVEDSKFTYGSIPHKRNRPVVNF